MEIPWSNCISDVCSRNLSVIIHINGVNFKPPLLHTK